MATKLLDLSTLTDRPTVVIDGVAYALRATDDFSIFEYHQHCQQVGRFSALMNQAELTEAEGAELKCLLDAYCRRVLDAPADVHAKLSDGQRLRIVTVFARLLGLGSQTQDARSGLQPETRTGASSWPDSPGSTGEIH